MSLIIVDGVSASGKSIALKNIQKNLINNTPNFSKLIITEHLTERFFEDKLISKKKVLKHVDTILKNISNFTKIRLNSRFKDKSDVLTIYVERLILTFYSRGLIDSLSIDTLSPLLQELESKHYLLVIPNDSFRDRIESTLIYRNKFWKDYVSSLGGVNGAINYFKEQQDRMIEGSILLSKHIPAKIISIDDVESDFYNQIK